MSAFLFSLKSINNQTKLVEPYYQERFYKVPSKKSRFENKKYYMVAHFKSIISFRFGLWGVNTAKNLGLYFVRVNTKNVGDFKQQ